MKYCPQCGTAMADEMNFCSACGSPVGPRPAPAAYAPAINPTPLLNTLSQRLNTNGIIWLVIGALQILGGLFIDWVLLIVGVLNIISAIDDMNYSKTLLTNPTEILKRFEPLTGPIITLVYNLVFGGVIGVAGSIYYLVAIRNFVMEHKVAFSSLDRQP